MSQPQSPGTSPDVLDVVVVDDDARWRETAAQPFRQRGDRVRTFSDGLQALAECIEDPPNIILSDVQMPRMDGWQLLRMIRARPALARTPFVFLTSLDGDAERLKGYQLGVDAYVPKPFRAEELLLRVRRLVRQAYAPPSERGHQMLRGDLQHVAPAALMSFLAGERKSGQLLLVGEKVARVLFSEGKPVRAEVEGERMRRTSRAVILELLSWDSGEFELSEQDVSHVDEVRATVNELVLEHAKLVDEGRI
ncbi:MAG TPA: response regulator [Polyangiaceae bacterium]|nr:response regulator [Polyangiaceae bacterium]HMR75791.1 response regulator [Polyangiaceae bacterium]